MQMMLLLQRVLVERAKMAILATAERNTAVVTVFGFIFETNIINVASRAITNKYVNIFTNEYLC